MPAVGTRPDMEIDVDGIIESDEERRARIMGHPYMDPRLKALLLDEELYDNKQASQLFGITVTTAYDWASPNEEEMRPHPHPRILPRRDEPLGTVAGRDVPGRQVGRLREWGMHKGWFVWHRGLGQLIRTPRAHRGGPRRKPRRRPM